MNIEQQILCLAARTQRNTGDAERLLALLQGQVDWERLWQLGHLHEVLPLLANSLRPLAGAGQHPSRMAGRGRSGGCMRRSCATPRCATSWPASSWRCAPPASS